MQVTDNGSAFNKIRNAVDFFSASLVSVVVISVLVAIFMYSETFESGLSRSVENWAAFSSFVGGLFGPLISFLTLLAILKTIGLQKQLLDTQRSEFKAMQVLQGQTLASQLAQIQKANAEADRRVVEETRLNILRTLEHSTSALNQELTTKRRGLETLFQWVVDGKGRATPEEVEGIQAKIKTYEKNIASMITLYDSICFEDYESVDAIKAQYKAGMQKIWID